MEVKLPRSNQLKMKSWALEDRPREKLVNRGKKSLTDSELMAVLIGSGNKEETSVELSRRILSKIDYNLTELGRLAIGDLVKFKGIGQAKAISIVAALELGRRMKTIPGIKRFKITSSRSAFEAMEEVIADLIYEEFWIILLNRNNKNN